MRGRPVFEEGRCGGDVVALARRQDEAQRSSQRIGEHGDLGSQSASGAPQRLVRGPPFSGRRLLMGANDGAVDHQVEVVAILGQCGEDPISDAGLRPSAETGMDALPDPVTLRRSHQHAPERKTHRQSFTKRRLSVACSASNKVRIARHSR